MEIDIVREERQKVALRAWRDAGCIGAVEAVTGFGKTYMAVMAIKIWLKAFPDDHTIVIVPTIKLKQDWEAEVIKHELPRVRVYVINTYTINAPLNFEGKAYKCGLLIIDEAHHALNEASKFFSSAIGITDYTAILAMSATLSTEHKDVLAKSKIYVVDTISLKEARRFGYIADYDTFTIPCHLTEDEKEEYEKYNGVFKQSFPLFDFNLGLMFACMGKDNDRVTVNLEYESQTEKDANGKPLLIKGDVIATGRQWRQYVANRKLINGKEVRTEANKLQVAMSKRKTILYNSKGKIETALQLIKMLGTEYHTMVFCKTKATCEYIAKQCKNAVIYHSGMTKTEKAKALELFENPMSGKNVLCTVDTLNEGFNVERVDCAIRVAYSSKSLVATQQIGRTVRRDRNNPNKRALVINLFVDHFKGSDNVMTWSKDKRWLRENLKGQVYEELSSITEIPLKGSYHPPLPLEADEEQWLF